MIYQIGLNITVIMIIVRGVTQVLDMGISKGMSAGIAGIGHILLSVSIILILLQIKKSIPENN